MLEDVGYTAVSSMRRRPDWEGEVWLGPLYCTVDCCVVCTARHTSDKLFARQMR